MPRNEENDRIPIPPRPTTVQHIILGFDAQTLPLFDSLLRIAKTNSATLKRIEKQNEQILAKLTMNQADSDMAQAARESLPILSKVGADLNVYTPES